MKRPFINEGYCGILLIIISVVLMTVNPTKAVKLPNGFFNPVVAFEFINSETEVYDLFGTSTSYEQDKVVKQMEKGIYIDFLYMCVYLTFLLLFSGVCRRITDNTWFYFSGIIALCVFLADFNENIQLLTITKSLTSGGFNPAIQILNNYTWIKWGGLSAVFISFIPFLRKAGTFGFVISLVSLISAVIGSAAFLHRSFLNEIYILTVALIFTMLIIFSFTFSVRGKEAK